MQEPSQDTTNDQSYGEPASYDIEPAHLQNSSRWARLESAFGPLLGGLLIDLIDLSTFGPIGIFTGMIIGGGLALWICSIYGIKGKQRWLWTLLTGAYCTIPMTEFIPIATLFGAYARYVNPPAKKAENECAEDTR